MSCAEARRCFARGGGCCLQGLALSLRPRAAAAARDLAGLARLRGDTDLELAHPDALQAYLEDQCGGLLTKLYNEWYEPGGALRPAYALAKATKGNKSKK